MTPFAQRGRNQKDKGRFSGEVWDVTGRDIDLSANALSL